MNRLLAVGVLLLALVGCQRHDADAPPDAPAADVAVGWQLTDLPEETSITYRDSVDAPGVTLTCTRADKVFSMRAPNPVEIAPIERETATITLGYETFVLAVAQEGEGALLASAPVAPQLLRALTDAKSARLGFRDGFIETGVDTDGVFLAFSKRCEALTAMDPAP